MLYSIKYWQKRLKTLKEFGIRLTHVQDMLVKFPDDYIELRKCNQEALKHNYLNIMYIRQEIETLSLPDNKDIQVCEGDLE